MGLADNIPALHCLLSKTLLGCPAHLPFPKLSLPRVRKLVQHCSLCFFPALTLLNCSSLGTHSSFPQIQVFGGTPPIIQTGRSSSKGDCGHCCVHCPSTARLPISHLSHVMLLAGIVSICLFQVLSLNCSTVPGLKTTCYVARLPPISTEPSREPPTVCGKNI